MKEATIPNPSRAVTDLPEDRRRCEADVRRGTAVVTLPCSAANHDEAMNERYFLELAAAFVRGRRDDAPDLDDDAVVAWGLEQGLRLHKLKRKAVLPRVRRAIGMLRGMAP